MASMKKYYTTAYGGSASIQEHRDGTATLRTFAGGVGKTTKCKSVTSAKRTLSRWCDGMYQEQED